MKATKNKENKPRAKTVGKVKAKVEQLMEEVMVAAELYSFVPTANKKLGGCGGDTNIMVVTKKKQKLVLKVCKNRGLLEFMKQQREIAEYLETKHEGVGYPTLMPALNGEFVPSGKVGGKTHFFRLMKFIEGAHLDSIDFYSKPFLRHVGRVLGEMSLLLKDYPGKVLSNFMINSDAKSVRSYMGKGSNPVFAHFFENYEGMVMPTMDKIPKVVIHGDFHPGNIIVDKESQKIIGIIDFGCSGMSHPGYDLGTIICHMLGDGKKCQFEDIMEVLMGFCQVHPLTQQEIECLYYWIGYRTVFLFKFCKWRSLVEYIMVENGPKYTNALIKEALEKQKK